MAATNAYSRGFKVVMNLGGVDIIISINEQVPLLLVMGRVVWTP